MYPIQIGDRNYPRYYKKNSKLIGPPNNWIDRAPNCTYQLNIQCLPKSFNEIIFMQLVSRFGLVYQFRSIVDASSNNKCKSQDKVYLRYTILIDALAAMELLNRYFLPNGGRLNVCRNFGNQSLDVAQIPKDLYGKALHQELRCSFPNMMSFIITKKATATIHFESHDTALWAMQNFANQQGMLRDKQWNVTWSTVKPLKALKSNLTFIVRGINNIHLKQNLLNEMKTFICLKKITLKYIGNQLVVAFKNPADACRVFLGLQKNIFDTNFSIRWARNSPKCWSMLQVSDFCAELRMICIANGWRIPIILFGRNFHKNNVQYGSVLLSDENGTNTVAFLMEVITTNITDIQSTMCEVTVAVVNKIGGLPKEHLIFKVTYRYGHEVCKLKTLSETPDSYENRIRDWRSIHEMASTLYRLLDYSDELILSKYKISFLRPTHGFNQEHVLPNCRSVYPKYRNKPPLPHNLNDTEIVMVLHGNTSGACLREELQYVDKFDDNTISLKWNTRKPECHIYDFIHAGSSRFYHPDQRINNVPVWLHGHTYRRSTKNYISL